MRRFRTYLASLGVDPDKARLNARTIQQYLSPGRNGLWSMAPPQDLRYGHQGFVYSCIGGTKHTIDMHPAAKFGSFHVTPGAALADLHPFLNPEGGHTDQWTDLPYDLGSRSNVPSITYSVSTGKDGARDRCRIDEKAANARDANAQKSLTMTGDHTHLSAVAMGIAKAENALKGDENIEPEHSRCRILGLKISKRSPTSLTTSTGTTSLAGGLSG
jgi:hypothetical protein